MKTVSTWLAALALLASAGCNSPGGDDTTASDDKTSARCLVTPDYKLSRFHHAAKCVKAQSTNRCATKAAITACLTSHRDYDAKATGQYVEHLAAQGLIKLR